MTILFVMDSYGLLSNGTSATAQRFAKELSLKGHTVRILSVKNDALKDDPNYYGVAPFKFPIFQFIIDEQGFIFAETKDEETIYKAIEGADVVHLFLPFPIENKARLIANKLGIPVTCAFHLQPENITYTLYLGKNRAINRMIYKYFYLNFYRYVRHVHCPSQMIANQLKLHHYKNNVTHVISNGVSPFFKKIKSEKPEELKDKFVILMIGRLSREKRQDLIVKAIGHSKYNKDIQLILCGQGPNASKIEKLSKKYLVNQVKIKFVKQEELLQIINYSDLYIHSSDAEIEAIACIEAFTCGLVPVISDSSISATNQFALDDKCLFKNGNYKSLSHRIDYFIENPVRKAELSEQYIKYAERYGLDYQVTKLEEVFKLAIEEHKQGKDLMTTSPSKSDLRKIKKIDKKLSKLNLGNINK